jgi:hypothetical protein
MRYFIHILILGTTLALSCKNPFAPALDTSTESSTSILSDQTTVEGVFQNFKYAYTFKDTTIYSRLLDNNFTFIYRDYDAGRDVAWGRDDEIRITYRLFQNAQNLDLIWNNIVAQSGDSLKTNAIRSFNLTITFNPSDIIRLDGKVDLTIERPSFKDPWLITRWRDESNF